MGVTQLWQILAPVEQHRALSSLSGQTIAVDLSIWVCENQCVKQMQGVVSKPYLRNLFFRISHLTQLGVKLVFVIEGSAPELKWDTMMKRQQTRFPGRQGKQPPQRPAGKQTRRNFNSLLKECCELLEILGIPYIQSKGEAEALCALLNANGLVDGCLTNDGDAFLYGATTVYRNFTMNSKDPHVEMYRSCHIQSKLGIDRGGLIALGLLIGCDFVPKGVPGIGIANAVRLLQSLQGQDVLIRLQSWSSMTERECVDQTEILARRKAIQVPDFPQIKIIDEFLCAKDRCPSRLPEWKRPVPAKLQEFSLIKLEWPVEYTIEKVLPLITLWDMLDLSQSKNPSVHQHLKPHRIVKTRIRQGEPCYEVEWIKPVTDTVSEGAFYITVESQELFTKCYPGVVKAFITQSTEAKKKPKAKKKKKKVETVPCNPLSLDNLSFQFEKVNLGQVTAKLQDSVKDLHPSFSEYDETALTTKAKQPRHLTLSPNGKKPVVKSESSESRKPVSVPFSLSEETVAQSGNEPENNSFVPLSQRVKLRMQNKQDSNKENEVRKEKIVKSCPNEEKITIMKSPGVDLSNMSSLLEDIQNLSLNEADKLRHKAKVKTELGSVSKLHYDSSPHILSSKQTTPMSMSSRKFSTMKDFQKMSSPSTDEICTPMTYMKHKAALGDSFDIQKSPYYIENPFAIDKLKSEKKVIDISSPGFFSRPEPKKEPEVVDTRCTAEKLIEKIEKGISKVGTEDKGQEPLQSQKKTFPNSVCGDNKFTVESLMSILSSSTSGKGLATPTQQLDKPKSSTPANQSSFGLETSLGQFGDFQIQHSLLNSLCSGLVQALTPKGVSMTKDEYNKLLNTLNEMGSEDEDNDADEGGISESNAAYEEVKCNIDFSELEKASSGFKNLNQKLLLKPIQIDDEDVMAKLSKSARKKLRRRERKKEQELQNLSQMKNVSKCKGRTKSLVPDQSSRRNSVKSSSSDDNVSNKKIGKRKNSIDNVVHNTAQTKLEGKVKLESKCVNKTNTKSNDHSNNANLSKTKNSQSEVGMTIETPPDVTGENDQKLKKKKKKKKVKKASPLIDISAEDSFLDDKKFNSCAEYLKKALENNQRKSSENKILKASPFMDVSADDTLLELEGLSCKVVGDELDSCLETKLKKKKRLSKEKLCSKYGSSKESSLTKEPVLSINDLLKDGSEEIKSDNSHACMCEVNVKQENIETKEIEDKHGKIGKNFNNDIKSKESVDTHDLCKAESPDIEANFDGTMNMPSSDEVVSNVIKTDANFVEDEIEGENQVGKGAANKDFRDFKHSNDTKELLQGYKDKEKNEFPRNTDARQVDSVDNFKAKYEEFNAEWDKIERTCMCVEDRITNGNEIVESKKDERDVEVNGFVKDGDENIKTEDTSINFVSSDACPNDATPVHIMNVENLDTEGCEDNENVDNDSFSKDDVEILTAKNMILNYFEALNTYHKDRNDEDTVTAGKTTSVDIKGMAFIDTGNDSMVLNSEEKASGVIDDINTCKEGIHFDENTEHRARYRQNFGEMDSECYETVDSVKSESETAGVCIDNSIESRIETMTTSDIGLCVLDHINGIGDDGLDEEDIKPVIHPINNVNGIKGVTSSPETSENHVELIDINGKVKEEKVSEADDENYYKKTSSDNNFGRNDTNASEVFHSPACLADRLKLKLRKTSTKNVLDMFTNGK